jgi:ribonuclease J
VAVVTGSQGEHGSAFHRLAFDLLPGLHLRPGDVVLHAARIIPGSEKGLAILFDHCVRRGACVVTATDAPIHVSGHPHRRELGELLALVRPRVVLPIHGRRRNLEAVATLALQRGSRALVAENFQEMAWDRASLEFTGDNLTVGRVLLDEVDGARLDPVTMRHRRSLASDGLVAVVLPWSVAARGVLGTPRILHWGLRDGAAMVERLGPSLEAFLRSRGVAATGEAEAVRSTIAAWLRKELRRSGGRRPLCDVVVLESPK